MKTSVAAVTAALALGLVTAFAHVQGVDGAGGAGGSGRAAHHAVAQPAPPDAPSDTPIDAPGVSPADTTGAPTGDGIAGDAAVDRRAARREIIPELVNPSVAAVHARYAARLAALRPDDPEAYFLLGEEIADATPADPGARSVATRLFVLAMTLDLARNPARPALAASACIALADVDRTAADAKWLVALAERLDPRHARPEWLTPTEIPAPDSASFRIATAMGMIRTGEGVAATRILNDPAIAPAFQARDRMFRRHMQSSARELLREASRWPCSECGNQRVVRRQGVNPPDYRLCGRCAGTPGPTLTTMQLADQLRVESMLLGVSQRSWGAQVIADYGAPVVDPDPSAVARAMGVDATATKFVDGVWVVPPAGN
jgi:hypothetical protein